MNKVQFGPFSLDAAQRRLERDGVEVPLQPKVFETLRYLVEHPGRVITRDEFSAGLWPDTFVGDAALTRCVKEVRRALGDDPRSPDFVRTVPGVGYRFDGDLAPCHDATPARLRVLAVLPFRPVVPEEEDAGLELGMADALITRLSGLRELVVRPLATVRSLRDPDLDPLEAGRALGVDAILEGSLQRSGERLRISVRVLRCDDGRALLAEQYEQPIADLFDVQDTVCRQITSAVSLRLQPTEEMRLTQHETENLTAYRHFLRGRLGLGRVVPEDARRSIAHFEKALEADPRYAQALVSLAEANIIIAWQGLDTRRYYGRARDAAGRARDLQPDLGSAWAALATVAWEHDWDWTDADAKFERAVKLTPNAVDVWGSYSASCAFSCRYEQAVRLGRRAMAIDPTSPMAAAWLAQALHMAGRPEEAIAVGQSVLTQGIDAPFTQFIVGLACLQAGHVDQAIDHLETAAATGRSDFLGVLAHAYVLSGKDREARALEDRLCARREQGTAPPIAMAMIHAARSEAARFFSCMEQTFEQPSLHAALIASEPLFAPLRPDPRAQALIRRLGLAAAS